MRTFHILLLLLLATLLANSCDNNTNNTTPEIIEGDVFVADIDSVLLSFVFTGCNRVGRHSKHNPNATDASTANLSALKRIYQEAVDLERRPDLFFFLGDMVLGESNLYDLNTQLSAWARLYEDTNFSKISVSNIEMVAVPGNHEFLYYEASDGGEYPLKDAINAWMTHMQPFLPNDRIAVAGADSLINRASFAFSRGNVGFVVMNTDTYDAPSAGHPYGEEGQIPTDWIVAQLESFKADAAIEHIFVLGHKPYYIGNSIASGHSGIPDGAPVWKKMEDVHAIAMLSAHIHDYQHSQINGKVHQVIAGNGGSPLDIHDTQCPAFFGYTIIDIMKSGRVNLTSKGFDTGNPCYVAVPQNPTTVREQANLQWHTAALHN